MKVIHKSFIILICLLILLINGCAKQEIGLSSCQRSIDLWIEDEVRENPETDVDEFQNYIMHTYCGEEKLTNGKITTNDGYKSNVEYIQGGQIFHGPYMPSFRVTTDWLKDGNEDMKITAWWDYATMIRGIAKKNVVLTGPSNEFLEEQKSFRPEWDPSYTKEELSNHSVLIDIATIFVTEDVENVIELMNKYDSEYLLVTKNDFDLMSVFNRWVVGNYTTPSENSILFKAIEGELEGFELIYSDDYSWIYKIK